MNPYSSDVHMGGADYKHLSHLITTLDQVAASHIHVVVELTHTLQESSSISLVTLQSSLPLNLLYQLQHLPQVPVH